MSTQYTTDLIGDDSVVLQRVVDAMSVEAKLALFAGFRSAPAVNCGRTRRLVLRTWLRSPDLVRIVLAHRREVGASLVHAMGHRQASIVRRILCKEAASRGSKELRILRHEIERWADRSASRVRLFESVAWALRAKPARWYTPAFARRFRARGAVADEAVGQIMRPICD